MTDAPASAGRDDARVDWVAAEQSPEFRKLMKERRRFVLPATIFFLAWYFGFILLAGYAEGFMAEQLFGGLTVGYALALTQFVMVWVLGWLYLRKSERDFDPLARKAAEAAVEAGRQGGAAQPPQTGPSGAPAREVPS